jgi:signal transduction histidine kinase
LPIRWRLTLFNALAIGVILLLLGAGLFFLLRSALLSGVENDAENRATAAARTVQQHGELEDAEQFALQGVFVIVRDKQGRILEKTADLSSNGSDSTDPVWRQALSSSEAQGGTARLSQGAPDYVYAVPVNPGGSRARVVEAGRSYGEADETIETFGTLLAIGLGVALLLSVAGAYLLARTALRPVDAVVSSAQEIGETDLSARLPVHHRRDEIGRLASTFNELLSRIETAFARREEALVRQRRFAADASHELRTPLTSIRGYARMLEDWGLDNPKASRRAVAAISKESERLKELAESLLALTRGDEGAQLVLARDDLTEVAREAVESVRGAVPEGITVEYEPPDHPIQAAFDREKIRQVITILLDNAVKYTPSDSPSDRSGGRVSVEVDEHDGEVRISVADTGIGIAEDQLPLIFERFHRVDEARSAGGAGLGLSIAKQIADAHGGSVRAESTPGAGSTFILCLPGGNPESADDPPPNDT